MTAVGITGIAIATGIVTFIAGAVIAARDYAAENDRLRDVITRMDAAARRRAAESIARGMRAGR